jgi:sulfite exporter TauE/SafE
VNGRMLAVVALVLLGGLGMVGGGVFLVVVQETGTPAMARITECHDGPGRYGTDVCRGMWVAGGSLLEGGRVVTGTVDGADKGDVGRSLEVRLSGDRAYVKSLRVAIILIVLGLALTAVGARLAWMAVRGGRAPRLPA